MPPVILMITEEAVINYFTMLDTDTPLMSLFSLLHLIS